MNKNHAKPCTIALGMFDGMHPGHRAVIDRAVAAARELGILSRVYTFYESPRAAFAQAPAPLMSPEARARAMRDLGVDEVTMVRFTREMAGVSPRAFIKTLCEEYGMRVAVAGADYTFGARASGNADTLRALGREMGFETRIVPLVMIQTPEGAAREKVSSSRIRGALAANRPDIALALMHGLPVRLPGGDGQGQS